MYDERTKQRFWSKIDVRGDEDCHNYLGYCDRDGYGRFWYFDTVLGAHRVAWELTYGPIPEGMLVLHCCNNPSCCNIRHLKLGTPQDNVNDMVIAERNVYLNDERHGMAKFSNIEVMDIMYKLKLPFVTCSSLAREYGVSKQCISRIKLGKRWKAVTGR